MAQHGEAADYYTGAAPPQQPQGAYYQGQPYGQQPPQYGQNYAPPRQGPPPMQQQNGYQQDSKQSFEQAFKLDKPKYNDWWAGLLFIAVFLGYVAVSVISIRGYSRTNSGGIYGGDTNNFALNSNTIILFAFVLGLATVFSYAYMWAARKFTKQFIWITGILNIIFGFVTAIYMLSRRYWSGGIVFLLFSVFYVFCFISWIPRIPFSVLMLQTAIDVSKKYGHTYIVSLVGGLLAAALGAWYSVTLVSIYVQYTPNGANSNCRNGVGDCGSGKVIGLLVFVTFAMYWISEWLKNTIHTTISGVYGSWYFNPNSMPKGATRGAFKRSVTYSFGSISLGSLLVAIIQTLRQLCSAAQRNAAGDGNMVGAVLFCVLGCLIGILNWAVEFLNRYAFSYIALYGKSYVAAAKDTWKMIKDRGIDALVNECLIGPVLSMGATFIAYACALLAYLYLIFTSPEYNSDGAYTPVVVAFSFLIGLQICNIFTTPLSSGIDTIFVAMAWDPEVLMREHPDLYHRMIAVYPHVQQAIHA
ncbi:putative choline transporter, neither null mutation nor overexpression affects choline transport [Alternaria arbusti]|uniref:putative choline transporter, neither null mutation nor overexpression affects choline transport n=1 Tax=Alternaria arbusti TaxID=232088 RepID=UPI00221E70CE|nr:putative choline transporter, neither null mutation nor overexpression affects choline transport [Alternaria arbusti]KAI4943687.1 putative choline transporter, neither null mutation nor overexpression affects choline transport [Alternaria arbusti]